tara:strand:- start:236 stop:1489 length:1254 start_codon:yes stop_codon:yes gene_type:complete
LFLKKLKNSTSFLSISKLATGNILSQFITLIFAPVLSRFYGPEAYGVVAIYITITSILDVFTTFRYELAILIPEKDKEAISLIWLSFIITTAISFLSFLILVLFKDKVTNIFDAESLGSLIWFIPISLFVNGLSKPLVNFLIREQKFNKLSNLIIKQRIVGQITRLILISKGSLGLIIGQAFDQITSTIYILNSYKRIFNFKLNRKIIINQIINYKDFGLTSTASALFNSFANQFPILILASNYSVKEIGVYFLVERLILIPVGLISNSTSQVFISKITDKKNKHNTLKLFNKYAIYLIFIGIIYCFFILLLNPLLPFLLGKDWIDSLKVAIAIIPIVFSQIAFSTLGIAYEGKRIILQGLFAQIILCFMKNVPLLIFLSNFKFPFISAIWIYSSFSFVGYFLYFLRLKKYLKRITT